MDMKSIILLIFKLLMIGLFLGPFFSPAHALDELFDLYDSPQGLAMGNAFSADATGYAANYYNPAGLAKGSLKNWEITIVGADGMLSTGGIANFAGAQSFAVHRINNDIQKKGGGYFYQRANLVAGIQRKGFGFSILGTSELAEKSDGFSTDFKHTQDLIPTFGGALNLAGNLLKIGVSVKGILRREVKGTYFHEELATAELIDAQFKEGVAIGTDLGMLLTLPHLYLPTLALVCHDLLNTEFLAPSRIFTDNGLGRPGSIPRSLNAAVSLHRDFLATFSFEFKHIERTDLPWQKRTHFGTQIELGRSWYFWGGMNQLYPTGGIGLRVKGGNIEIGSYAVDIGPGDVRAVDRRISMRYTIGF